MKKNYLLVLIFLMNLGMVKAQDNPLLGKFSTPHEAPPFTEIKNEHFLPAFKTSIEKGEAEIESIIGNDEKPTFENTIEALDRAGKLLGRTA